MSSTALRVGLRTLPICPIMKNANNTFGLMLGWFVVGRRWNSAGGAGCICTLYSTA